MGPTSEVTPGVRRGLGAWWFAWLLSHGEGTDRSLYGERKRDLLGDLGGTVVEIGPGAGVNLPYYGGDVRWIGVEPNVHFHPRLRRKAQRLGLDAAVHGGVAERLPLPDASADAVVSTLVLCSVDDPAAALAEVRRVLKPGGRFVFIEHVAAPGGSLLRRVQRWVRPAWGALADGCRPDRETGRVIASAGFAEVQIERFDAAVPLPVVRPHIVGTARRARN
jgi:ubiquinone/menaquinone biosynthesis C-methylase UbiE